MRQAPNSAPANLENLLLDLFSDAVEVCRFVTRLPDGRATTQELPNAESARFVAYCHHLVEKLEMKGTLTATFFEQLLAYFPGRGGDIRVVHQQVEAYRHWQLAGQRSRV